MGVLFTTAFDDGSGSGTYDGRIFIHLAGTPTQETVPAGVTGMNRRPVGLHYKQRFYLIGQFSRPLVRTEFRKWHPLGISAPLTVPTLSAGTGSGGSVAAVRGKLTFAHKEGTRIVHESSGGDPTNSLDVSGQGRVWSGLPTTSVDARANTIRGYLSFDGDAYRFAWERPLGAGVTSVEENVKHLARGELLNNRRGVPPYTRLAAPYHQRFFYAMDPKFPFRAWYSEPGEPESVHVLNYRDLPDGLKITGLSTAGMNNDTLVLFSRTRTFDLQGYEGADFNLRKVNPIYGNVAPFGPAQVHGFLVFPSERGLCMYSGGAVHFLGGELEQFWRDDFETFPTAYQNGFGFNDKSEQCYLFVINKTSEPKTFRYVLHYADLDPARISRGVLPRITFDVLNRQETAMGAVADTNTEIERSYVGGCDGIIRRMNIDGNGNDDSDTYNKKMVLESGHDYFEDVGGDRYHGKVFQEMTVLAKNESQAATLKLYAGNDQAPDGSPKFTKTIPAGAASGKVGRDEYYLKPHIGGHGLTWRLEVQQPVGVEFRGMAGTWTEGLKARPSVA